MQTVTISSMPYHVFAHARNVLVSCVLSLFPLYKALVPLKFGLFLWSTSWVRDRPG